MLVADQLLPGARAGAQLAGQPGYQPGFTTAMMLKDLRLAQAAAQAAGAVTPWGQKRSQLYNLFAAGGNEGLDFSAIIKMIDGNAA